MDEFESALDDLLRKHDTKVARQIDAGACRTSYDYRRADQAEQEYLDAKEDFIKRFGGR